MNFFVLFTLLRVVTFIKENTFVSFLLSEKKGYSFELKPNISFFFQDGKDNRFTSLEYNKKSSNTKIDEIHAKKIQEEKEEEEKKEEQLYNITKMFVIMNTLKNIKSDLIGINEKRRMIQELEMDTKNIYQGFSIEGNGGFDFDLDGYNQSFP